MGFCYETNATKKWRIHDLDRLIDAFEDDVYQYVKNNDVRVQYDYTHIMLNICGKTIVTFREILTLSAFGYPDGAFSLARGLYEHMILLAFFEKHKTDQIFQEIIDDFFLDGAIKGGKEKKYCSKYFEDDTKEIDDRLKKLNELKHCKAKGDYWWTGLGSFAEVANWVINTENDPLLSKFLRALHLAYKQACVGLHSNSVGNMSRLGFRFDQSCVDTGYTINGHGLPLWYATSAFIYIVGTLCINFGIDYAKYKDELNNLAVFYKEQEKKEYLND